MVHICTPDFSATCGWVGCTFGPWASGGIFGQPVPLEVSRFRLEAGAHVDRIRLGGTEAMIYVIAGSGTALAPPGDGERFALGPESVLWLSACDELTTDAGADGLDLMVARSTGPVPEGGFPPLRKVFAADELPHLVSTRDTRDRLDLVTENVPVGGAGDPRRPDHLPPRRHRRRALPHRLPSRVLRAGRVRAAVRRRSTPTGWTPGTAPWSAPARCTGSRTTPARTSRSWSSGHRRRQRPSGP